VAKALLPVEGERCFNIDFDDMLYLPVINNWIKPTYDCIFLDEAQDLNTIQHTMINKLLKNNGRLILAGDPQQSIYGFRGAMTHGMLALTNAYVCTELPLSIGYRCTPAIVKEANIFVTDIESADYLKGGVVKIISLPALIDKADNDSMVLCRTNAPLVAVCLSLIAAGKPATVIGNDVHQHVLSFVKRMGKAYRTTTPKTLGDYATLCANMAQTLWQKQKIEDIKEILLAVIESDMYTGEHDLKTLVEEVFAEQRNCIRLSTIHKMKGKEADKVFLLHPDKVPIKYAESLDEIEQEYNLLYVAITRAKSELYYITDNKEWEWRK